MIKEQVKFYLDADHSYTRLSGKQGDKESRWAEGPLYHKNILYTPASGAEVVVSFYKPDKTKTVYSTLDANPTVFLNGSKVLFQITEAMQAAVGTGYGELIIKEGTSRLSTAVFSITIKPKAVPDGTIESSNEYQTFMDGIDKLELWEGQFQTKYDNLETEYATRLTDLDSKFINVKYPKPPLTAAIGNGIADDTNAIQACINACAEGGTVYIPDGTYMVRGVANGYSSTANYSLSYIQTWMEGLKLKSNMNLILSEGAVLKMIPNASKASCVIKVYDCDNVVIKGGKIDGNWANQTLHAFTTPPGDAGGYWDDQWRVGIFITQGSHHITVQDVTLYNHVADGIFVHQHVATDPVTDVSVERCNVSYCGRVGINFSHGLRLTAKNCKISNIIIASTYGCRISAVGIDAEPNGTILEDVEIDGCDFYNVQYGVSFNTCKRNATLTNCYFSDSGSHDIDILVGNDNVMVNNCVFGRCVYITGDNAMVSDSVMERLYFDKKFDGTTTHSNITVNNCDIGCVAWWAAFDGTNKVIIKNSNINRKRSQPTTAFTNSFVVKNIAFDGNHIYAGTAGGSQFAIKCETTGEIHIINNTFHDNPSVYSTYACVVNFAKKVIFKNNVFENANSSIVCLINAMEAVVDGNSILCDCPALDTNAGSVLLMRLEVSQIYATNNVVSSTLTNKIYRGIYPVDPVYAGVTKKCFVNGNLVSAGDVTTPILYYGMTNNASCTNMVG